MEQSVHRSFPVSGLHMDKSVEWTCADLIEKGENEKMELYIHIPFCIKKCDYCDFLSFSCDVSVKQQYMHALDQELLEAAEECEGEHVSSIFIGGGTPSVLEEGWIAKMMDTVCGVYSLTSDCEITIEANPGTLNPDKLREYRRSGINRLSLGCQSATDRELRELGRIHTFEQFLQQYELARECGFENINVDLMSGIPGQSVDNWEYNLRTIAELSPEHISAYSLIVEEGTPYYERFCRQELLLPSEEEDCLMYERTGEILKEYDFHQYEISNYARAGRECRHNVGYWKRVDYLGVGLGSSSLRGNQRFRNTRDMQRYLSLAAEPKKIREEMEVLSWQDQVEEFMFLGLRLTDGISVKEFHQIFGKEIRDVYKAQIEKLMEQGLLKVEKEMLCLTRRGISLSNQVFVELLF